MPRPMPNLSEEELKARSAMWVKRWRDKYPEKQKLARKRAYNNRKIKAILKVGEVECVRCGCDELDFLEFNHIGGNGCQESRKIGHSYMGDRLLTGARGTEGLEILCRVCNALDFLERKNNKSSKNYKIIWKTETIKESL